MRLSRFGHGGGDDVALLVGERVRGQGLREVVDEQVVVEFSQDVEVFLCAPISPSDRYVLPRDITAHHLGTERRDEVLIPRALASSP